MKQMRRDLGYEDGVMMPKKQGGALGEGYVRFAVRVFFVGILCAFVGMVFVINAQHDWARTVASVGFFAAFAVAPALLVYPLIRGLLGEERKGLAAVLSALIGLKFESVIKGKLDTRKR